MKKLSLSLLIGLIISILSVQVMGLMEDNAEYNKLLDNTLRLHIKANSNTNIDQALKLAIRDDILLATKDIAMGKDNYYEAIGEIEKIIPKIKSVAKKTITRYGFNYTVNVSLKHQDFPDKTYSNFTMPRGNYFALTVNIGEGDGENWWCVLYPPMCLGATAEDTTLEESFSQKQQDILKNPKTYKVKFKLFELFNSIFKKK